MIGSTTDRTNEALPEPARRLEELGERLEALEARQDRAQSFTSPANLVGIAALVVSGLVAVFTVHQGVTTRTDHAQQDLTAIMEKLAEIDAQEGRLLESSDPNATRAIGMALGNRRMALLESADRLISSLDERVSPAEYAVLGTGFFMAGDFERAEEYMQHFVDESTTPVQKAIGLRSIANLHATRGAGSLPEARISFAEALEAVTGSDETLSLRTRIDIRTFWAQSELAYGHAVEALEQALRARNDIVQLPCSEARALLLGQVEPMIASLSHVAPQMAEWVGEPAHRIDCLAVAP